MPHILYIGIGSNLGDKENNILMAIKKIEETIGVVERQSSLLVTEPQGFVSEHLFVNAVVRVLTEHTPLECLYLSQAIERQMGRVEKSHDCQYKDRIIDIDLLLYDDVCVDIPGVLQIPHPRMYERDFVTIPLREVMETLSPEDAR